MGREEQRLAVRPEAGERLAYLARSDRVEPDRRLVEKQDLGVVQQPARDVEALAHAARVRLDPFALATFEADQLEELRDARALLAHGHSVEICEVAQVVERREPVVEAAVAA